MLRKLIKIRLLAFLDSLFRGNRKSNKKNKSSNIKKILIFVFAAYIIFILSFSIGGMFSQMARQMIPLNLEWLYFSYISISVLLFNFIGSVFTITNQIHEGRDNDLLLSMPILPRDILLSRIGSILIVNYVYTLIFALPAYIVYVFLAGINSLNLLIFIVSTLMLPFLAMSLSSFIGWFINLITMRLRRKNIISAFFQVAFFGLYMFFMMNINTYMQKLIVNGEEIGNALKKSFPPAYSFGIAVANADFKHFFILIAYCLIPFIIAYLFMSKTFISMATTKKPIFETVYVAKEVKPLSVQFALLKKELYRFFTLPAYILNSALGVIFEMIFAVYIIFNADKLALTINTAFPFDIENLLPYVLGILLAALSLMNYTAASSLSLEGSALQLLKSMPLEAKDIFNAKIRVNIILGTPSIIISGIAVSIAFKLSFVQSLLMFFLPFVTQSFIAVFGMLMNILFPRFDWRNETYAIKQSMSVFATMFGGLAVFFIPSGLSFFFAQNFGIETALLFVAVFFIVLSLIIYKYIYSKGQYKLKNM